MEVLGIDPGTCSVDHSLINSISFLKKKGRSKSNAERYVVEQGLQRAMTLNEINKVFLTDSEGSQEYI